MKSRPSRPRSTARRSPSNGPRAGRRSVPRETALGFVLTDAEIEATPQTGEHATFVWEQPK